ncbi:MAG TPA: TolC family protein, partial [Polyangia bacterium]|nr:TolC family protein [Polyangia bacterium]
AANGRVGEARSGYLPQVTGTATYERTTANYVFRPGVNIAPSNTMAGMGMRGMTTGTTLTVPPVSWGKTYDFWSFGVTGSQLIYDFNTTINKMRSAAESRDAAESSERVTVSQALLGVRRAYFAARGQRDLVLVANEAVATQKKHLDQIVAMVSAGMKSQIDLATQRTQLANSEVQAVVAGNQYAADLALLNQAMGTPGGTIFDLTDTEMPPVPGEDGDERPLVESALKARPEIAAAEKNRRAQELTVRSERGGYFPALSGIASLTAAGTHLDELGPNWFVGAQATWALLAGGLTGAQIREAKGTLAALDAQADAAKLQVEVDVVQGRLAVRAAKASIGGAEEALANAREQLRLAEARYQTGQGSIIELADAQVAYTTAEAQEVSARYSLASARAQLLTALGTR